LVYCVRNLKSSQSEIQSAICSLQSEICILMISFILPPLTLEILVGDIAAERTDGVVNAANNAFWMGSGVAGALKARGGQKIEADAMAQGPVEPGGCVITSGGQLPASHVIHAAVMGQDLRTSATLIDRATRGALQIAEAHQLRSIAFPALGTGVGGFPPDACARIMIDAIRAHAKSAASLRLVRLVLFGQAAYRVFAGVAGELLGELR
jgi:O-acetyl-ADP-ribose deacetylase (regulator of RNase III)